MTTRALIQYEHYTTQIEVPQDRVEWAVLGLVKLLHDPKSGVKCFTLLRGRERWEHFLQMQTERPAEWEALKSEYTNHTA